MTRFPSRKAKKAATRAELKAAALRCFAEQGVADASVANITKAAGVAHGTFYVHFRSKEQLLDDLAADLGRGLFRQLQPLAAEQHGSVRALLDRFASIYFQYWREHRAHIGIYRERQASGRPDAARAWIGISLARLAGGAPEPIDLTLLQQVLASIWLQTALQQLQDAEPPQALAQRTLVSITLGVLDAAFPGVGQLAPDQLNVLLRAA